MVPKRARGIWLQYRVSPLHTHTPSYQMDQDIIVDPMLQNTIQSADETLDDIDTLFEHLLLLHANRTLTEQDLKDAASKVRIFMHRISASYRAMGNTITASYTAKLDELANWSTCGDPGLGAGAITSGAKTYLISYPALSIPGGDMDALSAPIDLNPFAPKSTESLVIKKSAKGRV